MATPLLDDDSSLVKYSLTPEEESSARALNHLQKYFIKNELVNITHQILGLKFDPQNAQQFVQDDSYLKGQLAAYRYLLACSEEAENRIRQIQTSVR